MTPEQIAAIVACLRGRKLSHIGNGSLPDELCHTAADAIQSQAAEIARLTAERDALKAAEWHEQHVGVVGDCVSRAERAEKAEAENARLRSALHFYADFYEDPDDGPWGYNSTDFGTLARAALGEAQ